MSNAAKTSITIENRDPEWGGEFGAILEAYEEAGGKPDILQTPRVASAVVNANQVLSVNEIEGVTIEAEEMEEGVRARITVAPGTKVEHPVHLCFGMTAEEGGAKDRFSIRDRRRSRNRLLSPLHVSARGRPSARDGSPDSRRPGRHNAL